MREQRLMLSDLRFQIDLDYATASTGRFDFPEDALGFSASCVGSDFFSSSP